MVGLDGVNLCSRGAAPDNICERVSPGGLWQPDNVAATLVVCPLWTSRFSPILVPLKAALRDSFLPTLMGFRRYEVTYYHSNFTTWGVNWTGIGIPEPTQDSPASFDLYWCEVIAVSLLNEEVLELGAHATQVRWVDKSGCYSKLDR